MNFLNIKSEERRKSSILESVKKITANSNIGINTAISDVKQEILKIISDEYKDQFNSISNELSQTLIRINKSDQIDLDKKSIAHCISFLCIVNISTISKINFTNLYFQTLFDKYNKEITIDSLFLSLKNAVIPLLKNDYKIFEKYNDIFTIILDMSKEFSQSLYFFNKYESVLEKLDSLSYSKNKKILYWVFFLHIKQRYNEIYTEKAMNLIEESCLLILTISQINKTLFDDFQSEIIKQMLNLFSLKNDDYTNNMLNENREFVLKEISKFNCKNFINGVFKNSNSSNNQYESAVNLIKSNDYINSEIQFNLFISKLKTDYESKLKQSNFNKLLFLNILKSDNSPFKLAPNDQISNNLHLDSNRQNNAFRRLNFKSFDDNSTNNVTPKSSLEANNSNFDEINNSPSQFTIHNENENINFNRNTNNNFNGFLSPLVGNNNFLMMTPMTRNMSINMWIINYIKNFNNSEIKNLIKRHFDISNSNSQISTCEEKETVDSKYNILLENLNSNINSFMNLLKENSILITTKREDITVLSLKLISGLIKKNSNKNDDNTLFSVIFDNSEFISSISFISFELVLYIDNVHECNFLKLLNLLNLNCLTLLKIINPIITFDLMNVSFSYKSFLIP